MESIPLTSPKFMLSCLVGAAILASASIAFQKFGEKDDEMQSSEVKPKAVLRDAILGAIFTAMAWTLVPESMESVTQTVTSNIGSSSGSSVSSIIGQDFDLQIGPARF